MGKQVEDTRASRRARRSYTPSSKAEVVALVRQGDRTLPAICRELDLSATAVRHWVQQAAVDAGDREGLTSERSCGGCGGRYGCSATSGTSSSERRRSSRWRPDDPVPVRRGESSRYPVAQGCRIVQVSRAADYAWKDTPVSARARADAALTAQIRAIHAASGGQYGAPRVLAELRAHGVAVGKERVARVMKAAGLRGRRPPRWVRTTTPAPTAPAIPDRVHGDFTAPAPDVLWVGDITSVRTGGMRLQRAIQSSCRRRICRRARQARTRSRMGR